MSVLFEPIGVKNSSFTFFIRIYTMLNGIGQIQIDNMNISALLYHRIAQTDFYWYEIATTNNTPHRISAMDTNVNYSVS